MKAMAFTEHGSVFSWVNKKRHIEKAGMKYIHGEEFYVTKTIEPGEDGAPTKIRDNYHCSLYAKNFDGVKELNQLSSASFNRQDGHYYYAPRITLDELINTSDNIIVSTACLGGILHNGEDDVREVFINFLIQNKHRCFLEIQHHSDAAGEQGAYNKYLFSLSKSTGIPLIAGTDTHALNTEHMVGRAILQKAKKVHFADEDSWDLTFKTYDELVAAYKKQNVLPMEVVLEAIENTNRLADMVEEFPLDESYKYPHLWADSEGTFLRKIEEGIVRRGVDKYPNYQEYRDRIEEELKAYRHNGAIDFMLLMEDILNWCRTQDIQVGYGRGSVNGSVIAWLLGITEMDSIKHNLNFERFMNIERVSLSDIDTDFPPSRIEEVKDYIFSKTGLYCSDIITFNTIADKGAIRDVGRALEIPLDEVDEICKAFESNEEKLRKKYPELFKYVDLVKGVIVSVGSHPCFTEDALVQTTEGYKRIKDVQIGDFVFTHAGNMKRVADVMTNRTDTLYSPKISLPQIKATGNHPFYVREKVKFRSRKGGIDVYGTYYGEPIWKELSQIKGGDVIGVPVNKKAVIPIHDEYALDFSKNELWWIIGRYLGDGWICDNSRGDSYLVICYGKQDETKTDILKRLVQLGITFRVEERPTVYRVYIYDTDLKSYLRSFGKYADGKYINAEVFDLPIEQMRHFLDGYISADGHYRKESDEYGYTTVSKRLALGIAQCVAKVYNAPVKINVVPEHDEFVVRTVCHCKEKYRASFHIKRRKLDSNFYEYGYVWYYCGGVDIISESAKVYNLAVEDDNSYTVQNVAVHNCGCIVSPENLTDHVATFTTSTSKYPISQIYMKEVDGLNYVKLDLLRLDTIELINDTCKLAGIQRLTPDNVDINDVAVWNSMRDDSTGIFQWESDTGADYIKKLLSDENIKKFQAVDEHVDRMTLLTIGNSAIRPAGASYRDDLANGVVRKSGSQAIDDFLKPTFGYLVFQCQIIEFLHQYCGFTMGEADIVRRHFAKKVGTDKDIPVIQNGGYMIGLDGEPKKDHYIAGFTETMKKNYGMSPEESEKTITAFLQVIIDASNYLFSLNHSQPYSYEGYVSGWLRYHYPVEFITMALNINVDKEEKTLALTRYAKAHGIQILPPKFRYSKAVYFCNAESREIYKGIGSIKFMNAQVADELYALKDEQFEDFIDLLVAVKKTSCNSRQLQILIELDYFSEFGDVNLLLTINNLFGEVYGKQQIKKDKIPKLGEYITEMDVRQFAGKESEKTFTKVDMFRLLKYLAATIQVPPATIMERISYQKENLGYVDIVDKKYAGLALVMSVNTKWTPWLTLYALANGKTIECKVDKRDYNRQPVKEGDVVRIEGQTYKSKQRKTENGFEAVPGSKVLWITRYRKVVV